MIPKNPTRFGSIHMYFLVVLIMFCLSGCVPEDAIWKNYSERWHLCFNARSSTQKITITHKFSGPLVFPEGTFTLRGDFDPINKGDVLPADIRWTIRDFDPKGNLVFQDSVVTPLDSTGHFSPVKLQLIAPLPFIKNERFEMSYDGNGEGIVKHDVDLRLSFKAEF